MERELVKPEEIDVSYTTDNCRYCLMCRHVCPVAHVTFLETLNPHGWGLLIASERRGLIEWNESSITALYSCADCGTCRAHCVTDQTLPEAISLVRSEVAAQGKAPQVVYELQAKLQEWCNPYQPVSPEAAQGQAEYALFVGDAARYLHPSTLQAALKLLESLGIEPVLVGAGRSNGYLPASLGLYDLAKELASANLSEAAAAGAHTLLVLTPGDYYTLNQLYKERLELDLPESMQVKELAVLLAEQLEAGKIRFGRAQSGPYAYVDPTHSVRTPERYQAPRLLLEAVLEGEPRRLFWRELRTHPLGDTALQYTQPEIAEKLNRARLEDAQQSGAEWIVTEDPSALSILEAKAPEYGLKVLGLYELLAEQIQT
jgi:heterodisulfide reductase subunit D